MVLQAFIDDSYTPNGVFVLGGYVASAEAWAELSGSWEELLPLFAIRGRNGRHRFKMSEMAAHMDRVLPFYRLIEKHALLALSCKLTIPDLTRARNRIWVPNADLDWGFANRPHSLSFKCLLDMFHTARFQHRDHPMLGALIPPDRKVDFYFDEQSQKREMLDGWDIFIGSQSDEAKNLYGTTPRFEGDEDFMPLQAADFWAYSVRKAYEDDTLAKINIGDFGAWNGARLIPSIAISFTEDQLVSALMVIVSSQIREKIGEDRPVYDVRVTPRPPGMSR
jgi:hypothetical protein